MITTDRVLVNPTVMVPKSSFKGLISTKPSLPAPMIVIALLLLENTDLYKSVPAYVRVRPDPGEKKPTVLLIWSKRFRVKRGMEI